jgi:tRNA G18 (ribose-2'-O)-methylase SpoU
MLLTKQINSLDIPDLHPYRTLRRPMDHLKNGIFVAEGAKVVRRLLDSDLTIISFLMTKEWYDKLLPGGEIPPHRRNNKEQPTIYLAGKESVESIVGYNLHQGIMAIAKLPPQRSLEETIPIIAKPHLVVALDGLVNAENVGLVIRNCAAFGVGVVIVGETSSSPYLRRAVRNSMGTVFTLPIVHANNLAASLTFLKNNHATRIIAAHPHEQTSIHFAAVSGNICIVFGNEGEGISQTVLEVCDKYVAIPMMNGTDSLNVASASAVFLYEARKQRTP